VVGLRFGLDGQGREPEPEAEVVASELRDDDPDGRFPPRVPNTLLVKEVGLAGGRVAGEVFDLFRPGALEPRALRLLPERARALLILDFLSGIAPATASPVTGSQFSFSLLGRGVAATLLPFEARGISPVKDEKTSKTSLDGRGDVRDGGENVSARVSEEPRWVFDDGVTGADASWGLKGGSEDVPIPSWKIEKAATAAAVALPLLDPPGMLAIGKGSQRLVEDRYCA
jgi:hypothetical protein